MVFRIRQTIIASLFLAVPALSRAQDPSLVRLPVGTAAGEVGVSRAPNEACLGPSAIAPAGAAGIAILDQMNRRILLVDGASRRSVVLPGDLVEPSDLIVSARGFVVAGALGEVVLLNDAGSVLARALTQYDPAGGVPRLVTLPSGGLALEDLRGNRVPVGLDAGAPRVPGQALAGTFRRASLQANEVVLASGAVAGPLGTIRIASRMTIEDARALWIGPGEGALVAVQERRRLPQEAAFVRLVALGADGRPSGEAYLPPTLFECGMRRPFARLESGRVIGLSFEARDVLLLITVELVAPGVGVPAPLQQRSDATLISEEQDVLTALERLNGTSAAEPISLGTTSRSRILERARAALDARWQLTPANFSRPEVPNRCEPTAFIWRRPARLDLLVDQEVLAWPYRWGGYLPTLDRFRSHLQGGRLAGDDCTCRNANCVHSAATGADCSGFVSYAWQTGTYYTTASLPKAEISTQIPWTELAPGDILNKARSHVRLVEAVSSGSSGRVVTVIESAANESCGGVCRRSYLQVELQQQGYLPFRRNSLSN
jgi:hypothetical protein